VVVEEIMRKGNFRFAVIALGLSVMLATAAGPLAEYAAAQTQPAAGVTQTQVPQPDADAVNWPGAGYGVGALFCNVLYIPAKLTYALLGGIVGGGTYLVTAGNSQAADTVWRSALGGDYVVTPQMLAGQEPLNFSGPTETPPEGPSTSSSSGSVAPIAPLPQAGSSASASSSAGGQPLDHGSGPAGGSVSGSNVE
jgi:hypothetical protein